MIARVAFVVGLGVIVLSSASPAFGDGVYFVPVGETADLAQTRQEAVLAHHDGKVTYVLRTTYTGSPDAFAWVMPLPAVPTDVVAHESSALFELLDEMTRPVFFSTGSARGCCCTMGLGDNAGQTGLVTVVASGQAGIFEWAALTSTGADDLLTWLNANDYSVPSSATAVLDVYVQQEMFFLAVRIDKPIDQADGSSDLVEVPPLQFTCQTTRRFYPMMISQISAAEQTEVLLYVIAQHRAEAANLSNGLIDRQNVVADPTSASGTNYEALFSEKIAELGGLALITESAFDLTYLPYDYVTYESYQSSDVAAAWPNMPAGLSDPNGGFASGLFLTRMRTVLAPSDMTVDFEFQDAATDDAVSREFWFTGAAKTSAASVVAQPLAMLAIFGLFCAGLRRKRRRRSASGR